MKGEGLNCYNLAKINFGDGSHSRYGVVKGFYEQEGLSLDTYEWGFPINITVRGLPTFFKKNSANKAVKISPEEFIQHLFECEKVIEKKLSTGDFAAAAWASRKHYMNGIIDGVIKQAKEERPHYGLLSPPAPHTGVYLICKGGNDFERCSLDPNQIELEALVIKPRVPIRQVAAIVQHFFPEKFGSVVVGDTGLGIHKGNVFNRKYFAYEIPKGFTEIIKSRPHQVIKTHKTRPRKK